MARHQKGNGRDRAAARTQLVRQLQRLEPKARLEALLDDRQAAALVRSLPADRLYLDIRSVGLADTTDVVQLASPAQFQSFVDLGAWKADRLDHHALLSWIRAARGDEAEAFHAQLQGLDSELLESLLREHTTIHDLEEEPDLHVEGLTLDSADGRFRVEFRAEQSVDQTALRALLLDFMAHDALGLSRRLESARWALPSELEEVAYNFRNARLSDLGFPDPETARSLFARVPLPPPPPTDAAASALASRGERPQLLPAALEALTPDERDNLEDELRTVVNAVLVDERADPGDPAAIRDASERARDTLELGLEYLSGGSAPAAAEVVRAETSRHLFQVGFTLGLLLKHRADRLARQPLARLDGTWLLWPDVAAAVVALRRARPLRALRVEGAEPVAFRSLRELHEAEAMLGRAEHQRALFAALLGGTPEAAREALASFGEDWPVGGTPAVLLAALAQAALGDALRVAPVPRGQLAALGAALLEGPADAPRLRTETRALLVSKLQALAPDSAEEASLLVDAALEKLLAEAGPALAGGELPPELSTLLPVR
ncbi:MAG: DUF6178 family protein [Myxococcaceae bacterium]